MAVRDHLRAVRSPDQSLDLRRVDGSVEILQIDVARAGQMALAEIARVAGLAAELARRPYVEHDETLLAEAALELVALRANPVVIERYTGASQASVRAAAAVAGLSSGVPPAGELLAGLAGVLGLSGTEHGWADAPADDAAIRIDR